jgi:hypothetical protein
MKWVCWGDICTPMFIAELFTMAKIWNEAKCPSMDERIKKMWCIVGWGCASVVERFLACARPWVPSPVLEKKKKRKCDVYGVLVSLKNEWNPLICNNVDEPGRH